MENAEEILQCLDEFTKLRPKEIPPELEYYLSFVARTGDPVYQWSLIKCLFREKLLSVITEFYEACPSIEIPPCPNVELFNYEAMKCFILEKLDTFAAAPFTVQRICELLTSPRKEYNRIDKYMRALEKNILVVSTREPGTRKSTENGESIVNGLETEHDVNTIHNSDINVDVDMDDKTVWQKINVITDETSYLTKTPPETVITSRQINYVGYTTTTLDSAATTTKVTLDSAATTTKVTLDSAKIDDHQVIIAEPITPPEQQQQQEQDDEPQKNTSNNNETIVSSSNDHDLVARLPEEKVCCVAEHEVSDTTNVVVIGPEDMQVEDISPEPEHTGNNSPVVPETTTREETPVLEEHTSSKVSEDPLEDPAEDLSKDPSEDLSTDPSQDLLKDPSQDLLKDPAEDLLKDPSEDLSKDPVEDPVEDPSEQEEDIKKLEDVKVDVTKLEPSSNQIEEENVD